VREGALPDIGGAARGRAVPAAPEGLSLREIGHLADLVAAFLPEQRRG